MSWKILPRGDSRSILLRKCNESTVQRRPDRFFGILFLRPVYQPVGENAGFREDLTTGQAFGVNSLTPSNSKNNSTTATEKAKTRCKLGLDVHAASIMVARQVEGLQPQPPQKFKVGDFVKWVKGQVEQGWEVISCYEAGPTGYWLHRKLTELGVTNYVVCPTRLDSRGKGVNTDKTDALELVVRLDR